MEQPTDAELIRLTRSGDDEAFAALVNRYKDALVNYLTHLTGSRDRAEEFAQEALVRLYCAAGRYDERGKLAPYLFRIATNLVRSEAREVRRWAVVSLLAFRSRSEVSTPHAVLAEKEVSAQVRRALAALPLKYRAPLVLREIEEWSYREIADALGCREGTIKSRIARGRGMLRHFLAGYWATGGTDERRSARASLGTPS